MSLVYVASAYADFARTRAMYAALRAAGHTISQDWTVGAENGVANPQDKGVARNHAEDDLEGIFHAHVFVLLTSELNGCGMWVEYGYALANGCKIIVSGPQSFRLFCSLADVCVETDADVIPAIAKLVAK